MGAGYVAFPLAILFFYIIPIRIFFSATDEKGYRSFLLGIPIFFTLLSITFVVIETKKTEDLYRKFPQANKLIFLNPANEIRDSICQLQSIMEKLPRRSDYQSVSYSLNKRPEKYHSFSFNWFDFDKIEFLEQKNNLRNFKVPKSSIKGWTEYVSSDLFPFDTLTSLEAKKFISLLKYLDKNNLNAANLEYDLITFDYNDSLRISNNLGFRTVTLDTNWYFNPNYFTILDKKNGFYLLSKK